MTITFNTNVSALTAQRYLGIASSKTSSSLAKLTSGSRVPTAKDDAAALAIGTQLKAEVSALGQASNNAGQATSLLQIADGALSTVSDILNRQKTLAVQASSGQLDNSARALLNQEFTSLQSEIDRIAGSTNFNGNVLLNGGDSVATGTETQAGYLSGKGITTSFDASKLGASQALSVSYNYTSGGGTTPDTANLTVTNLTTGQSQTIDAAKAIKAAEGATGNVLANLSAGQTAAVNFDAIGVTLNLNSSFAVGTDITTVTGTAVNGGTALLSTNNVVASAQAGASVTGAQLTAITGGTSFSSTTGVVGIGLAAGTGANKVNVTATTGLEFSTDGKTFTSTLTDVATNAAGNGFYVRAAGGTGAGGSLAFVDLHNTVAATTGTATVNLDLSGLDNVATSTTAAKSFSFKVGTGTTANDNISFTLNAVSTTALGTASADISTAAGANTAISSVTSAITTVAARRADIGASESRLGFASASVNVAIENTTAAESNLLDVDVSSEITSFSSQQVLLQAGVSLLAQANQQPSLLLKLLQ